MWYNKDIEIYANEFKKINEKYCKEQGYDFFYTNKLYTNKSPSFNKLYMLKELLNKNEYDYYLWIDADAHIHKMDSKIEHFIKNDKDFIWSGDITPNINCGVFIIKNSDYSKLFLNLWCDTNKTTNPDWWEQGVLTKMWIDNDMDIREHSHCWRYGVLQHFQMKWDNFIYHMAGTSKNDRINYIKCLNL
jgi:hypothetical protein